jgi:hypothetical protein
MASSGEYPWAKLGPTEMADNKKRRTDRKILFMEIEIGEEEPGGRGRLALFSYY